MVHKFFQFRFHEINVEQLMTSHFVPPWLLIVSRCFFSAWTLIVVIASLVANPNRWGFFLTYLSYLALTIYICSLTIVSILHARGFSIHRVVLCILTVLYETLLTVHVIVPFVYWLFLSAGFADRIPLMKWLGVSVHGMDFVVVFAEFMLCRVQVFPIHMVFMVAACWAYLFYSMIIFATNGLWVYPFLDWSKATVAIYYVAFTIAVCLIHLLWWGLTLLKNKLSHYDPQEGLGKEGLTSKSDVEMGSNQ